MGVIARQSIKGALANYLGVAIGFVTTFFVLTRFLTEAEVGLTRMMVDFAMLFSTVAQLGTSSSVVKFFPWFKDGDRNHGIFGWSLLLPLIGFLIFGLVFLLFSDTMTATYVKESPLLADYLYMLPMLTFFSLYMTVFETNASVLLRITVPKLVREVGIRVLNLVAYLLYGFDVISLDVFVWMFCGSYGLAMIINFIYLLSLGKISFKIEKGLPNKKKCREILLYSLFMTVTILAGNIPLINSLFLGAKIGQATAGVYAIASYIANVVEIPYRSLGAISRPVISEAVKSNDWKEVNRLGRQVSLHQLIVSCIIFFIIWINLDALFDLLPNGDKYIGGAGVVLFLGLAKMINSSLSICTDVLNYSRKYMWGLLFTILLTIAAIWLNTVLIDVWGINGSACATLFAYLLYFILLISFTWYRLHMTPFSEAQVKMIVLTLAFFGLNKLWVLLVASAMPSLLDSIVKTIIMGGLMVIAVYYWKISPTINMMVDSLIKKI